MTAALPMGNQKITGMADPTVSTDGATKNYVDTTTATFFSTGDVKLTLKSAPDSGWLMFDDGTIGSATSGATSRANADTQTLFTLIYNGINNDTWAPLFTSGGSPTTHAAQGSAAAAWAANCRISLPKALGRALAIAGSGASLTARALGQTLGAETQTLGVANLPPYTPAGTVATTISQNAGIEPTGGSLGSGPSSPGAKPAGSPGVILGATSTFTGAAQGGTSTAFSVMNPATYLNAMVKL